MRTRFGLRASRPPGSWTLAFLVTAALPWPAGQIARAQIPPATMATPVGYPKDFAVVKRDGLFHVFYIQSVAGGADFNFFGHQTSPDLYHWTMHPNVLVGGRNGWNRDFVWAPSIIERDGVYFMFYTGVRTRPGDLGCLGAHYQQIGVATSTNLADWTLEPDSWLDPSEVAWSLQPADSCTYPDYGNFRDPFVVQDPATGEWLMYYVAVPDLSATSQNVANPGPYDSRRYVVGLAHAPASFAGDADWTDLKALWITHEAFPDGGGFRTWESPHVFRRDWQGQDLWFLVASVGHGGIAEEVDFLTSPSATAGQNKRTKQPAWTWQGRIDTLGIVDSYGNRNVSQGWFATEYFQDPETGLEYFADCNNEVIEFRQLKWRMTDYGFDLEQPYRVKQIEATPAQVISGETIDLTFLAKNVNDGAGPKEASIEALLVDAEGESIAVVPAGDVGLLASVPLAGDETHLSWTTAPTDSAMRLRVRLRAPSTEVQTGVITVLPISPVSASPPAEVGLRVRPVATPGRGVVLVIELPAAMHARLDLYDARGDRIRVLGARDFPQGATPVPWEGTDDAGRRQSAGIYFARLTTRMGVRTARLLLLR